MIWLSLGLDDDHQTGTDDFLSYPLIRFLMTKYLFLIFIIHLYCDSSSSAGIQSSKYQVRDGR